MDAAQWPQQQVGGLGRTMEEIATPNSPTNSRAPNPMLERRERPQKEQNLNCPRCNSTNTKFCYYNNYSLTQPRYFCKTCRRYWTQGGSLRNVPVGGGSRKNKRSSSSSSSSSSTSSSILASSSSLNTTTIPTKLIPDLNPPSSFSHLITASQNPNKFLQGQDLNLAFPIQGIFHPLEHQLPKIEGTNNNNNNNENHEPLMNMNGRIIPTTTTCSTTTSCGGNNNSAPISALELLRTGIASRGSLNSYAPMPMPDSNTLYPSGFPNLHEFKPNLGVFSSPGDHNQHHGNDDHMIGSGANNNVGGAPRLLFPFADMNKLASSTTTETAQHHHHEISDRNTGPGNDHHHNNHHHQGTTGYWTGMLGGGTW